jgi:uncharacterized membrane protein
MKSRAVRRVKARYFWDRLKVSFWFAPAVLSLFAIFLAWVIYGLDRLLPDEILAASRMILSGDPDQSRSVLISLAATILTVAGVVFTLLTIPLSTVVAQYGSRLLRVFLGDRTTQAVLGMFVGTFVYCLAAALSILPPELEPNSPQLTTTFGLALVVACFGSLILLVQHISTMLQAPQIAAAAGKELIDAVAAEMPEEVVGQLSSPETLETLTEVNAYPVRIQETGYIQYIDPQVVLTLARESNLVIQLLFRPGDFIGQGTLVALVWPVAQVNQNLEEQILEGFQVGNQRTPTQDVRYAVNQLVEMAVRAMSPAINDPFTAMTCLDYIGQGLELFLRQGEKRPHYYLEGRLCLILHPVRFEELLNTGFDMLRHCSADNAYVLLKMLAVIDGISREAKTSAMRQELFRHVSLILAESQAGHLVDQDLQRIRQTGEALQTKLESAS